MTLADVADYLDWVADATLRQYMTCCPSCGHAMCPIDEALFSGYQEGLRARARLLRAGDLHSKS